MEAIFSQNQMGGLGGTGIGFEGKSSALDLDITGNTIAGAGLAPSQISAGILLRSTTNFNVKINENVIESIGPGIQSNVVGILIISCVDLRIAGNRVVDVGPPTAVMAGGGVAVSLSTGSADIVDNEVRRASIPPSKGDFSQWYALGIEVVFGDANIRGNRFESFGSTPTVLVGIATRSCCSAITSASWTTRRIVSYRQPWSNWGTVTGQKVGALIASSNYVQATNQLTHIGSVMILNANTLTVVGNITSGGDITVGASALGATWNQLNVIA